jgi:hypothetical protein
VATHPRKSWSGPEWVFVVFRGRIWGHASRWGAKGALSGEARVDRFGENGDVSKVAECCAAEGFSRRAGAVDEARLPAGCPSGARGDPGSRQMGNGMRTEGHNAT